MVSRRKWLGVGAFAALAVGWLGACEADLETTCVGGDGTCDPQTIQGPVSSSSVGAGGGGGSGPVCFEGCDDTVVSGQTGDFPCEVEEVMVNCRRCHSANPSLQTVGPFPLDTYEESQQLYGPKAIWARVHTVVGSGFMPLQAPKLDDAQKAIMQEWACNCGPPREAGVTCD